MNLINGVLILSMIIFGFVSCTKKDSGHHGVLDKIKKSNKAFDASQSGIEVSEIEAEKVLVQEKGHSDFYTLARKSHIKQFSCTQCHNSKRGKRLDRGAKISHSQIKMKHGDAKTMNCMTCHNQKNRDQLKSLTGEKIDFNRSYNLCSQCHFQQKKDWVGGAHGKRVKYWAGVRVVRNCTTCHDPHKPQFPIRWPKTYSRPIGR